MQIKRCKRCSKVFQPGESGRKLFFCFQCCADCDVAHVKILDYLRHHPNCTLEHVKRELEIEEDFMWVMSREGTFEHLVVKDESRNCKRCSSKLGHDEREMCGECAQQVSHLINLSGIKGKAEAAYQEQVQQQARSNRRNDENDRRYGIGSS